MNKVQSRCDFAEKVQSQIIANGKAKISYIEAALLVWFHRETPLATDECRLNRDNFYDFLTIFEISTTKTKRGNCPFNVLGTSLYGSKMFDKRKVSRVKKWSTSQLILYTANERARNWFRAKVQPYLDGVPMMDEYHGAHLVNLANDNEKEAA